MNNVGRSMVRSFIKKRLLIVLFTILTFIMVEFCVLLLFPNRGGSGADNLGAGSISPIVVSLPIITTSLDLKPAKALPEFKPDFLIPPITNGMVPVITNFLTKQKVVFLTIDDGAYKDQSVVDVIQSNGIRASLFLSKTFISGNPDFFKQIISLGSLIEDHTISHDTHMVTAQTYAQQKQEICDMAEYEYIHYGRRPIFFRPPGGAYSDTMRRAAADCGMKAVVTWIAKANGGSIQYQIGNHLRPGDIVLMHFRPEFKKDMQAFLDAQNAAGLHTELLEDLVTD
jgi:peptidoglycan/xylan/chitin deacetylase (PgdA/CDA1 family)